ncbi:TrgA family protein [Tabrizicola caldifontis]|uniref:TrgA family protein n=1 Tax=Tabrizicola caldifontis TaxID=2528036 RepID=UPI00108204A0|nr:TrgA family protein [Rhodobacter sp. YIM 73028]
MATPMPTGAKAMAAVSFAVVGWLIANAYVTNMPEAQSVGFFRELTGLLGAIVGWRVMGPSVGKGYLEAIGSGWKTVIVLVFFALLLSGIYEMLQQSVRMRYDGPMEAIIDVFRRMMERSQALLSVGVMAVMVVGGGIAGVLTENANRRWR